MSLTTTTHLNFRGNARVALEFYHNVFGGQLSIATYADFGMPKEMAGAENVVFGQVESVEGFRIMAYDIPGRGDSLANAEGSTYREHGVTITNQPFFVSVRGELLDEVQGVWEKLSVGATIIEALAAAAWSPGFGMLTDTFGVTWILDVASGRDVV